MERLHTKPDCEICKSLFEKYKDVDKDDSISCEACVPQLLPQNQEAAAIYFIVQSQVIIAGMSGEIVDLNYTAVKTVMDWYNVENQRSCFEKIRAVFQHMQDVRRKEKEERETFGAK